MTVKTFSLRRILVLAVACNLFAVTSGATAQELSLSLGTATPGGGFAVYGQALSDALRESGSDIRLELRGTKGSRENIPMLEAGQLDLALVEGTIVQETLEKGAPAFRVIAAMYSRNSIAFRFG